jgi:hypothetical protein
MVTVIEPDEFNSTAKLLVDRDGKTFEEANEDLASRKIQIDVGTSWTETPGAAAAVLTAVNCGARAFLGGVNVRLACDGVIEYGWGRGMLMSDAIGRFGGTIVPSHYTDLPTIALCGPEDPTGEPVVYATWSRWSGGIVTHPSKRLDERNGNSLSGALAGAIGISECFQNAFHGPVAGRRDAGLSLWKPSAPWLDLTFTGPQIEFLPDALWLGGLGHLGQAYAWILGLFAFPFAEHPSLVLQDFDEITEANESTSMLASSDSRGELKTRVVSGELEALGFETRIVERRFDENLKRQVSEPRVILSGFDNYRARRALGTAGFDETVDAGLGARAEDYLDIKVRSFQGEFDSQATYREPQETISIKTLGSGYEREIEKRVLEGWNPTDVRCGIVELAGKAVGASFVGTVAAALVLAEVLRPLHGGSRNHLVHVNLEFPSYAAATESASPAQSRIGFIRGRAERR